MTASSQKRVASAPGQRTAIAVGAVAVVLACATLWAGYAVPVANAQAFQPENVVDAIDAALYLTQFKAALDQAGLLQQFQESNWTGTVFAPSDQGVSAYLAANNLTLSSLDNATLSRILEFHIVPTAKYFPPSTLRQDAKLTTAAGPQLRVDRSVPGLIHVWAGPMEMGSTNFGTILQFQEIRGGQAVLYVIDRLLEPPAATP